MRRLAKPLLVLVALLVATVALRNLFASEETRIRWRIESMMEGFNDTRLAPAMQGIGADWRDRTRRVDRTLLADGLRYLFFNEKDPQTKRFPYRVELDRETLAIEFAPDDRTRAEVTFEARFEALADGEWTPTWRLRVSTSMHKHENLGWQLQESEHETLESDGRLYR